MLKAPPVRLPFFCCGKRMVLKEACVCFIGACDGEAGADAAWRAKQGSEAQAQSSCNACLSCCGKPTKLPSYPASLLCLTWVRFVMKQALPRMRIQPPD